MTAEPPGADLPDRLWLADLMWRIGCVQFGDFSLGRTVRHSPVYLNPKLLISRPEALTRIASLIEGELRMAMAMRNQQVTPFDVIAGVPIGGLHIATALSLQMKIPLLYARPDPAPEQHERPHIEGIYRPGETALIVDDLAAGGGSLVETAEQLSLAGLRRRRTGRPRAGSAAKAARAWRAAPPDPDAGGADHLPPRARTRRGRRLRARDRVPAPRG